MTQAAFLQETLLPGFMLVLLLEALHGLEAAMLRLLASCLQT